MKKSLMISAFCIDLKKKIVFLYSDEILDVFSEMDCKDLAQIQFFISLCSTRESLISKCDWVSKRNMFGCLFLSPKHQI